MNTPSITQISQMLNDPATVTDTEMEAIQSLQSAHPYFIPAYYLQVARMQQIHPYSSEILDIMHRLNTNWLLFNEFLHDANSNIPFDISIPGKIAESTTEPEILIAEHEIIPGTSDFTEEASNIEHDVLSNDNEIPYIPSDNNSVPVEIEERGYATMEEENNAAIEKPANETEITEEEFEDPETLVEETNAEEMQQKEDSLIQPLYTEDYFMHEGVEISNDLPPAPELAAQKEEDEEAKSLMVMMSFSEWLNHFKTTSQKQKEEDEDKKALKTMWQKEKLAAAFEEENDEIPEQVFEMAVNSIIPEESLASEPLANIYFKQGKYDKAIDMYRKLSLRNPQKSAYFARKIDEVLKEKRS